MPPDWLSGKTHFLHTWSPADTHTALKSPIKLAIIGGKLQGVEACYLAKKAGFFSILIDKKENPPAKGMCDKFIQADICKADKELIALLKSVDFVLPAMENAVTLAALRKLTGELNIVFDFDAYAITSSKMKSDLLFRENNIPAPAHYPGGAAPYIAKPVYGSGSSRVTFLATAANAATFLANCDNPSGWIVQEYLVGKSYSIEVIGQPGNYKTYPITEIHVDKNYDCCMVTCPCNELTDEQKASFSDTAIKLAEVLKLKGIMDVEAILLGGEMKVLEIDARIPSQTPTVVYKSSGINLLEELVQNADLKPGAAAHANASGHVGLARPASVEHLEVTITPDGNTVQPYGEGIMANCAPLTLYNNSPSTDELITDYKNGDSVACCTLIKTKA